jgi:hypothetical protein
MSEYDLRGGLTRIIELKSSKEPFQWRSLSTQLIDGKRTDVTGTARCKAEAVLKFGEWCVSSKIRPEFFEKSYWEKECDIDGYEEDYDPSLAWAKSLIARLFDDDIWDTNYGFELTKVEGMIKLDDSTTKSSLKR